jgi:hypothetical protein
MNRFRLIQDLQETYASRMQIARGLGNNCDANTGTNQTHDFSAPGPAGGRPQPIQTLQCG